MIAKTRWKFIRHNDQWWAGKKYGLIMYPGNNIETAKKNYHRSMELWRRGKVTTRPLYGDWIEVAGRNRLLSMHA